MKILYAIWCALALCGCSLECMRVLQSGSYKPKRGYFKIFLSWYYLILCVMGIFSWFWWCYFDFPIVICALYTLVALVLAFLPRKSALKFTKRIWRIVSVQYILLLVACLISLHWWTLFLPLITLLSFVICLPIDIVINNKYIVSAQDKLAKSNIQVIAITGSFGKTSMKNMLCTLLDKSISPNGSCNTPLGIAKFVNGTSLSNYKFLILEFGARQKGDIKLLCDLYKPRYGIVTGVCEQHLSTFKTIQGVLDAKSELVECLPSSGFCVLCDDSVESFKQVGVCRKILEPQINTSDCKVTSEGVKFTANCNGKVDLKLPVITLYSVKNFAYCATVCNLLGQTFEKTVQNSQTIAQVPHRMEISFNGKFYIIDDSYNASIRGVESCCEILAQLDGNVVAISQGIVEGGKAQTKLNEQCGAMLGDVCSVVIVLGKNSKSLTRGISEKAIVLHAKSLQHAVTLAQNYLKENDYLLFQNDLPDVVNV